MTGRLAVVGLGPGDWHYLTPQAGAAQNRRQIRQATSRQAAQEQQARQPKVTALANFAAIPP